MYTVYMNVCVCPKMTVQHNIGIHNLYKQQSMMVYIYMGLSENEGSKTYVVHM